MEPKGIDELLNDPAEQETPTEAQPRDDNGQFVSRETGEEPQQETVAEPVPPTETEAIPVAALKDERRKRQELEQQVAAMQQQLAAVQQQPQQPPAEFWDDPQAFMASQFEQFGSQLMQRWQQEQQIERVNASEAVARSKYADFDDALQSFRQAVQVNPVLAQQMARESDPAEFAYRKGKSALELERVGSIDDLLKAERQKWEAELRAAAPAPSFPSTTALDGSVGARSGPAWTGPKPMSELLGG